MGIRLGPVWLWLQQTAELCLLCNNHSWWCIQRTQSEARRESTIGGETGKAQGRDIIQGSKPKEQVSKSGHRGARLQVDQHGPRQNRPAHLHMSVSFNSAPNPRTSRQLNSCGGERYSRLEPTAEAAYLVTALTFV